MNRPIPESYWVLPGRFLAGEYPGGFESASMQTRLDDFLDSGFNTFIDLTHAHELPPYDSILKERAELLARDVLHQRFPIRDHSIPIPDAMTMVLNALDRALKAGRIVYLHCWGGIGRTGTAVACHLVRHGISNEAALDQVQQWYETMPKSALFPTSPETEEQIQFVLRWHERLQTDPRSGVRR